MGFRTTIRGKFIALAALFLLQTLILLALIHIGIIRQETIAGMMISFTACGAVICIEAFLIGRSMFRQLSELGSALVKTETGNHDLTKRVPVTRSDATESLSRNINIFLAGLHDNVFKLKKIAMRSKEIGTGLSGSTANVSESIASISQTMQIVSENGLKLNENVRSAKTAFTDIDESIRQVASQVSDQTAAVTESSASIEQMVASIRNINSITVEKTNVSEQLTIIARTSEDQMTGTMDSIRDISTSAGAIEELLDVINGVAQQTNILAMNAAIEAAHAGEAGKGFSVVAEEIRKLSETTSDNAGRIGETLQKIISRIHVSRDLTAAMNSSLREMADGISNFSDGMAEMSTGLNEMTSGTEEITVALNQLRTISTEVDNAVKVIQSKSSSIEKSVDNISLLTGENTESFGRLSGSLGEIVQETKNVSELSSDNALFINLMDDELKSFSTIDKSLLKSRTTDRSWPGTRIKSSFPGTRVRLPGTPRTTSATGTPRSGASGISRRRTSPPPPPTAPGGRPSLPCHP